MFVYFGSICVELSDGGSSVRGLTLCWVLVLREMRVRLDSLRGLVRAEVKEIGRSNSDHSISWLCKICTPTPYSTYIFFDLMQAGLILSYLNRTIAKS